MLEATNKITLLTHQLENTKAERDNDRKELNELKEKYAEKSRYVNSSNSQLSKMHQAEA